jgi:hypothetical protein
VHLGSITPLVTRLAGTLRRSVINQLLLFDHADRTNSDCLAAIGAVEGWVGVGVWASMGGLVAAARIA